MATGIELCSLAFMGTCGVVIQANERFVDISMEEIGVVQVMGKVLTAFLRTRVIMPPGDATIELAYESPTRVASDFIAKPFELPSYASRPPVGR